ncbi:MAG: hypothetical protein ABH821_04785 [archaeon]
MLTVNEIGGMSVIDVIKGYPLVGKILEKHGIGCTTCKVGVCKLKDVVRIHFLPAEQEKTIFKEINEALKNV